MKSIRGRLVLGALALPLAVSACDPHTGSAAPVPKPQGPLGLEQAREYVLALVNHDREDLGLDKVEHDAAAERAGQRHAEDMVLHGYTAHWGSDGSVPEQRYSEADGRDFVQENAACFFDGVARELDRNPTFDPVELQQIETAFMSEKPPSDGHKQNIIKKVHNRFGVGLAKPVGLNKPCMSQEFVDVYGEYEKTPSKGARGQKVVVEGEVKPPLEFGGVGIARIDPAQPLTAEHLNHTSTYKVPEPYVIYFPPGFQSKAPKPVTMKGRHFSIDLPLDRGGGRYLLSVWAKYPGSGDALDMVSLRTVEVH